MDIATLISTQKNYENYFTQNKLIGEGGFAEVYEVVNKIDK